MLKISNLTIKNFLSVGNVTQAVRLDDNGLTLVLGSNTDSNGGTTRNGAGKSTILQAVSFALFGKPLTKIKLPNLINNINGKQMLVTVEFEEGGTKYKIERGKKPDIMKFYINTEEQHLDTDETKGENRHTQEEIDRLIGMSHTMFKHIVALNTFTDPFLKMTAADQRTVIEELLGITQISQRADVLKKLVGSTKESIRDHEAAIKATVEANDRLGNAIRNAEVKAQAWENNHLAKLDGLAEELATMEAMDFDAEIAIFDRIEAYDNRKRTLDAERSVAVKDCSMLNSQIAGFERDIARMQAESQNGLEAQIKRLQSEQRRRLADADRATALAQAATDEIATVDADMANADHTNCICCGQSIEGTDHLQTIIDKLEARKVTLLADVARHTADAQSHTEQADHVAADMAKLELDDVQRRESNDAQIQSLMADIAVQREQADTATAVLASFDVALAELGLRPRANFGSRDDVYRARSDRETIERTIEHEMGLTNPNTSQIDDLKKAVQPVDYTPLNDQTMLLRHQEFLLNLLTNKNSFIRKKIIDQNLAYLNARLNHYLDKLGLPHEVTFQSDLTVDITLLGRDMDFEQLSRGEMNRVIMATSWSFRDVWESQNQSINLCWIDELLDNGLDGQGVEAALTILKSMARDRGKNVFLISHREELQARIDKTLLVTKENGFTAIQAE